MTAPATNATSTPEVNMMPIGFTFSQYRRSGVASSERVTRDCQERKLIVQGLIPKGRLLRLNSEGQTMPFLPCLRIAPVPDSQPDWNGRHDSLDGADLLEAVARKLRRTRDEDILG